MNVSNFINEMLFVPFTAIFILPEMGEMAQSFMSEMEWLAALRCRATGLSTSFFFTERSCSANRSDRCRPVSSM